MKKIPMDKFPQTACLKINFIKILGHGDSFCGRITQVEHVNLIRRQLVWDSWCVHHFLNFISFVNRGDFHKRKRKSIFAHLLWFWVQKPWNVKLDDSIHQQKHVAIRRAWPLNHSFIVNYPEKKLIWLVAIKALPLLPPLKSKILNQPELVLPLHYCWNHLSKFTD